MKDMKKIAYESPELNIRWFESDDVIAYSDPLSEAPPIVDVTPDDEW